VSHLSLCTKLRIFVFRINVLYCGERELPRQSRWLFNGSTSNCRGQLKCDGTRAETRFRLSAKRTSPFKSARASIHPTTGSRGVRISGSKGSNAGYTMFRGIVKSTGYPLHQFTLHFPSCCLPCAIAFQLESTCELPSELK
jgi:hypothetical protein